MATKKTDKPDAPTVELTDEEKALAEKAALEAAEKAAAEKAAIEAAAAESERLAIQAKIKESAGQLTYGDAKRIVRAQAAHDAAQG